MSPLVLESFDLLICHLQRHGNAPSDWHRAALLELLDTFAGYVEGREHGRKAFALPTGMGKTSAIAAFVATLHKLDIDAAVCVAASKVEALCDLKRDFMRLGVPPQKIGLKHTLVDASEPSTSDRSFPYQLVTHARVRGGGHDFQLFGRHDGKPRALLIYDETMFRSDVLGLDALTVDSALGALRPLAEAAPESALSLAYGYLAQCNEAVKTALVHLQETSDSTGQGVAVEFEALEPLAIRGYAQALRAARIPRSQVDTLEDLLDISQEPLRVVAAGSNRGVIWVSEAVPRELRNVVVLDASHSIRRLASMDSSVALVNSFEVEWLKSFENVEVIQLLAAGGRNSIEKAAAKTGRQRSALSREVIDLVRDNWETAKGILVFTFKQRTLDIVDQLRGDLRHAGFDPSAHGPDEEPRIEFLTWGEETSLNGYEHCDVVIMAGVLHRAPLDLAAAIRGQKGDLAASTPNDEITETIESEIVHLVYQGASRGSCRRINDGKALPMKLYVFDRHLGLKTKVSQVMPNVKWETREPKYLPAAKAAGVVEELAVRLLDYLKRLPQTTEKVSSQVAKRALGVGLDEASKKAFQRAVDAITEYREHGWDFQGRSLVRVSFASYFGGDHEIRDIS
jgi:hypothetical protein